VDSPNAPAKAPLEPALRALAERERARRGPHLEPDELVAYHERKLGEAESERARDHLALCPECAGLLLDLAAFDEPEAPAGAPDLASAEIEAGWRELAPRLSRETAAVVAFVPRRPVSPMIPWAIAAALAIAVVGLSARVATLGGSLRKESLPQTKLAVKEAMPDDEGTRSPDDGPPPSAGLTILLNLHAPSDLTLGRRSFPSYDLEVLEGLPLGAAGSTLSGLGFEPKEGVFHVLLPHGTVVAGKRRLRLFGVREGVRERLADFDVTIGP